MAPVHGYKEQDAEAWPTGTAVAALSDDRVMALDLTQVPSMTQARRLMKRAYKRAANGWRGTIVTNLWGLKARDERYIHLVLPDLLIDHDFEVMSYQDDMLQVTLEISQIDSSIDDWDPATEEGTAPSLNPLTERELNFSEDIVDGTIGSFANASRAFNGTTDSALAACATDNATDNGYIGLSFDTPTPVKKALVYGSNDNGYVELNNPTVTLRLYGKQGVAPSGPSDGTLLGSTSFTDTNNQSSAKTLASDDWLTLWDHIWIRVSHSGSSGLDVYVAEIRFFV
jgi:hypothetical protein